jgi:hypothetical protein
MGMQREILRHPINGMEVQTWQGFSWPAFLFFVYWLVYKKLYGHVLLFFLVCIPTFGFAIPICWILCGIKGNDWHHKNLLEKGYLTEKQWDKK